jgi:hypothetical protein
MIFFVIPSTIYANLDLMELVSFFILYAYVHSLGLT